MKSTLFAFFSALTLMHTPVAKAEEVKAQAAPVVLGAQVPRAIVSFFIDYQCPNCRRSHDTMARVLERYGDEVQVQLRFLPMDGHHLGIKTVVAAYAAERQGRFMPMHVALTRTRTTWETLDEAGFEALLYQTLVPWTGLNLEQFKRDFKDPALFARVLGEREAVRDIEVTAVPTAWVNGIESDLYLRPDSDPSKLLNARLRRELRLAPDKRCQLTGDCGVQERIQQLLVGGQE